jgi:hypothetical protein
VNRHACSQHRPAGSRRRSPQAALDRRWRALSLRGNRAFARGNHDVAERHYREAIGLAQVAIGMVRHAGDAVPDEKIERWLALWVISHLNLCDLHAREARAEQALQTAFGAYEKIVECLHDTRLAARVHAACLRQMRPLLDGLAGLMRQAGVPDTAAARIHARAQALALGYWNAWA